MALCGGMMCGGTGGEETATEEVQNICDNVSSKTWIDVVTLNLSTNSRCFMLILLSSHCSSGEGKGREQIRHEVYEVHSQDLQGSDGVRDQLLHQGNFFYLRGQNMRQDGRRRLLLLLCSNKI